MNRRSRSRALTSLSPLLKLSRRIASFACIATAVLAQQPCAGLPARTRAALRDCRLTESGSVGVVDGQPYRYEIYCIIGKDDPDGRCDGETFAAAFHRARGLRILAGTAVVFDRVAGDHESGNYERPQLVRTPVGTVLYLPIRIDGTANLNESEYYLRRDRKWEPIESQAWLEQLSRRLPRGLECWKGIWPDLKTMSAQAGLYRAGDANCCPTGGVAHIRLAIRNTAFVLESVAVGPAN